MPAIRLSSVVLPEPDGPISATNSPSGTCRLEAVEHDDVLGVAPVDLAHAADIDRVPADSVARRSYRSANASQCVYGIRAY